jgi:hypothetical protein
MLAATRCGRGTHRNRICATRVTFPQVYVERASTAARVLLSDFDAWHIVLTGGYLSLSEKEDTAWEQRLPSGASSDETLPRRLKEEIQQSWERIFDFAALRASEPGGITYLRCTQAVIEEVRLEEVVDVRAFTAR